MLNINATHNKFLALTIIVFAMLSTILSGGYLHAQTPQESIQGGVDSAAGGANTTDPASTLQTALTGIINILTFIVGAVSVIMIIYGGYLFVTSAGDPGKVATAKKAFIYAVIGIAIAATAQIISKFVIDYF